MFPRNRSNSMHVFDTISRDCMANQAAAGRFARKGLEDFQHLDPRGRASRQQSHDYSPCVPALTLRLNLDQQGQINHGINLRE